MYATLQYQLAVAVEQLQWNKALITRSWDSEKTSYSKAGSDESLF